MGGLRFKASLLRERAVEVALKKDIEAAGGAAAIGVSFFKKLVKGERFFGLSFCVNAKGVAIEFNVTVH